MTTTAAMPRYPRWLLAAGALCYSTWPLAYVLRTGLGQGSSMTSDYEAVGHPWAWLFRLLDVVSGLAIGTGALLGIVHRGWSRLALPSRIALTAVTIRGYATALTGAVPTTCTAEGRQCKALHRTGLHGSWQDIVHHQVSGLSGSAMTIGVIALIAGWRLGGIGPVTRRVAPVLAGLLVLHLLNMAGLLWPASAQGIPQRLSELGEMVVFLALAADLSSARLSRRVPAADGSAPRRWPR